MQEVEVGDVFHGKRDGLTYVVVAKHGTGVLYVSGNSIDSAEPDENGYLFPPADYTQMFKADRGGG